MKRKFLLSIAFIGSSLLLFEACKKNVIDSGKEVYATIENEKIQLCSTCPPGFLLNKDNRCIAKNLYQQYESLQDVGVGGLKTALPAVRDGFTPQQIDLGRYLFLILYYPGMVVFLVRAAMILTKASAMVEQSQ